MIAPVLHLTVTTPDAVLVDCEGVLDVRAMDDSGSFGVRPGHVDLLTVLGPSVMRWREAGGATRYCALLAGVLKVTQGAHVALACRQGTIGDDLAMLEDQVRAMREQKIDESRRAQVDQVRLHARAVRQIMRYLHGSLPDGQSAQFDLDKDRP